MRDRLIGLLKQMEFDYYEECCTAAEDGYKGVDFAEFFADHLLANGVIVPPCKVGDTLWVRWSLSKGYKENVYPVKVYALRFDTKKNNMRICVEGHFKITAYGGNYTHYYSGTFACNSVGKTVFLTREEAERALERSEK